MPVRGGFGHLTPDPFTWGQGLGALAPVPPSQLTPDWVNIARFSSGNGSAGSPYTGWDTNVQWATLIPAGAVFYAPAGIYQAVASPAGWATPNPNFRIFGDGPNQTFFKFTGANDGFSIINGSYASGFGAIIEQLSVLGTAATTNAFHFKGTGGLILRDLKVIGGCTAAGLFLEGIVNGAAYNFACSSVDGGFAAATPVNGIKVDQFAASQPTTNFNLNNCRVQAVSGACLLYISSAFCNTFGGYYANSTGGFGIEIQDNLNSKNGIFGTDVEGNSSGGIRLGGFGCAVYGGQTVGVAGSAFVSILVPANATGWGVFGGGHDKVSVTAGAFQGSIENTAYNISGSGTAPVDPNGVSVQKANHNQSGATDDISINVRDCTSKTFQQAVGAVLTISANAIAPTRMIHHVGAGLIKNINFANLTSTGAAPASGYVLHIIPDAAYTYDATGNIVVPGGGGTATINRTMDFTWDGAKFTPSY